MRLDENTTGRYLDVLTINEDLGYEFSLNART